ncbi:MAG: VanW family protein [Gudongella sp.]|nr:VanW family protein [Gudongella sp.]
MKKGIIIAIISILILSASGLAGYIYLDDYLNQDKFYDGVRVEGIDLGGYTLNMGMEKILESKKIENENKEIEFYTNDDDNNKFHFALELAGYSYNYQETIESAFNYGKIGNLIKRYFEVEKLKTQPANFVLTPIFQKDKAKKVLQDLAIEINTEPEDAVFEFNDGIIKIEDHKVGKELLIDETIENMESTFPEVNKVELSIKYDIPEKTSELYKRINGVIGEFSTNFKTSPEGRSYNIGLSTNSFEGFVLMPGDIASYNEITGPKQAKFGYKEAPVILNGELTPGMGGGVCQTSTTLYNALLLADLEIIERHPHSIAASYVRKGTDGAVAAPYLDLKFRNNFDYPIYIDTKIENKNVYFYIYGDLESRDYSIRIDTKWLDTIPYKTIENLDNSLAPGTRELVQDGRTGYKVNTYKTKLKDGKVISSEKITYDYYRERDAIYKVGPPVPIEIPVPEITEPSDIFIDSPEITTESSF